MKSIIIALVLSAVLVAGCTQQPSNSLAQDLGNASKTVVQTNNAMSTQFEVESAQYAQNNLKVFIRNTGQSSIDLGTVTASIDGVSKNLSGNSGTLSPGGVAALNVTDASNSCNKVINVELPTGLTKQATIVC